MFLPVSVVTSKPPCPILQVLDFEGHVLQGRVAGKRVIQGCPTNKMPIFLPKNGLKMPISAGKNCFLGSRSQLKRLGPYLAGADSISHVYRV